MTATPLPKNDVVLTQEQIDSYITFQMARLEFLLAQRRRTQGPIDFRQNRQRAVRLVDCV